MVVLVMKFEELKMKPWVLRSDDNKRSIARIREGRVDFRQHQLWDLYRGGIAIPVYEAADFGGLTLVPPNSEYFALAFFRYNKIPKATWQLDVPQMPNVER